MRSQMLVMWSPTRSRLWATHRRYVARATVLRVGGHDRQQRGVDGVLQPVRLGVLRGDAVGQLGVAGDQGVQGALQPVVAQGGHGGQVAERLQRAPPPPA